uniref:Uncharacterized protein n=1 Tax=Oryza brachyantha TaxID=4533 RepID=J3L8V5_ORYBR
MCLHRLTIFVRLIATTEEEEEEEEESQLTTHHPCSLAVRVHSAAVKSHPVTGTFTQHSAFENHLQSASQEVALGHSTPSSLKNSARG